MEKTSPRRNNRPLPFNGPILFVIRSKVVTLYLPLRSRPESSQEHLPGSIAGVLRLRAIRPLLCDRSAKRFAQDDGFVRGLEYSWLDMQTNAIDTTRLIQNVRAS
jgi:hypothetical protein